MTTCICPEPFTNDHIIGCPMHDSKTCSVCSHLGTDTDPADPDELPVGETDSFTAPPGFCPLCLTDLRGDDADLLWVAVDTYGGDIIISDKHVMESFKRAGWVIKSYGRIWAEERER